LSFWHPTQSSYFVEFAKFHQNQFPRNEPMFMIDVGFVSQLLKSREPPMGARLKPSDGGSSIPLDKPIMLIGRNDTCDVALLNSSKVSRRHCCIVQCGDRYLLRDLGSMNGSRVNTHRIVEMELREGDQVSVADVHFTFFREESAKRVATNGKQKAAPIPLSESDAASGDSHEAVPMVSPDSLEDSSHTFPEEGSINSELKLKDDSGSGKFASV
jgi:pSer/pThr/pTyr-binding forkhead associated (FHA) protein